ncbi:hypothetical protein [Halorussus sp. AFM4]|uniref:DUF7835 family putative zinc beta-ribbon protein n=1 Tax=Halorussus sp. AFM4 TaxID=3421651 RepID=UPI003EBBE245
MAATNWTDVVQEDCERCGHRTPHDVSLEMRTESEQKENAEFSREPYRVSECQYCGTEITRRMNNA